MKQTELVKAIHTASPKILHAAYDAVCEAYAQRLCAQLGFNNRDDAYWMGHEKGDLIQLGDRFFLSMEEVVLIVDNAMSYDDMAEWYAQCVKRDENSPAANLWSWLKGARPEMMNPEKKE